MNINNKNMELKDFKKKLREAVANYMRSEGCSCCRDIDAHREHKKTSQSYLELENIQTGLDMTLVNTKQKQPKQ